MVLWRIYATGYNNKHLRLDI